MKKVLIINGHGPYDFAGGQLSDTLVETMKAELEAKGIEVKSSVIKNGYDIKEEQEKFKWADAVIYQIPVYWFDVPGLMKRYMDEVYEYGVFFGLTEGIADYGKSGMMKGRKYVLSTTWNAPEDAFSNKDTFMEGRSVDEALFHFHKTQEFIGLEKLESISFHDVVKDPKISDFLDRAKKHIQKIF